jgi:hypothetical protein
MVEKSRVVKRIKIPVSVIKKKKSAERLTAFWDFVLDRLKRKSLKIDVSKVFVGEDLSKILQGCSPYDWLDIGPAVDRNIPCHKGEFVVEVRSGFNLAYRRRTDCERVRRMLGGS